MPTALKEKEHIKVKHYITDKKGHKVAAVIDMNELDRLGSYLRLFRLLKDGFIEIKKRSKVFTKA